MFIPNNIWKEINKLKSCLNNEIIDDFFVCIFSPQMSQNVFLLK